jgi:hypothetical protein
MELRKYAKARTDLHSEKLTTEQAIWKALYDRLTEELRRGSPDWMGKIESLEKDRDDLEKAGAALSAKLKANPHDFGVRTWWGVRDHRRTRGVDARSKPAVYGCVRFCLLDSGTVLLHLCARQRRGSK